MYQSINRWKSVNLIWLISIVSITSVEIDDTLVSFIDLSRFKRFHRSYIERYICFSVHPKMKTDFMQTVICWQWSCNWESKDQIIYCHVFFKKRLKISYLFFKTRLKVFFWWPRLAKFFRRPVFHDLDLSPFQNNISSAHSYLPE